jgi:hypothetical protein
MFVTCVSKKKDLSGDQAHTVGCSCAPPPSMLLREMCPERLLQSLCELNSHRVRHF